MRIEVVRVQPQEPNLEIAFDGGDDWRQTPEGIRACRIVKMHVNAGYTFNGPVMTVGKGARVWALSSTRRCQAEMDRWTTKPIMFRVDDPIVSDGKALFNGTAAVREAQRSGIKLWAGMRVTATLPVLSSDVIELRERLSNVRVHSIKGDVYAFHLMVRLAGDRLQANPTALLRGFLPVVYSVIN